MKILVAVALIGLAMLAAAPVFAQQVQIEVTPPRPPEPEPRVVAPPLQQDTTRPTDADAYPQTPRGGHDPAFIEPLAGSYQTKTGSGRVGLSGWTAPNTPVGAAQTNFREVTGWFAIGFSVTWDGPPPAPAARPARPRR